VIQRRDKVRVFSHHSRDWTGPCLRLVEAGAKLSCKAAFLDNRPNANGVSDFDTLRSALHKTPHRIVFFAFDLLHLVGQDLTTHKYARSKPSEG
jgi:bifunctional non-homologous end joining protein LigD